MKVRLERYFWKDLVVRNKFFVPPNTDYEIYKGEPPPIGDEYADQSVELTKPWRTGNIVFLIFLVLLILFFVISFLWKRVKKFFDKTVK